jgi:hypothetical protein
MFIAVAAVCAAVSRQAQPCECSCARAASLQLSRTDLEVRLLRQPHLLIHGIQRRVEHELVQVLGLLLRERAGPQLQAPQRTACVPEQQCRSPPLAL